MARKQAPPGPAPLLDNPGVGETFATEVVGSSLIGNCISLTFATHRWIIPNPGEDPQLARVVVARLMLSGEAGLQLAKHLAELSKLKAATEAARRAAPTPKKPQ